MQPDPLVSSPQTAVSDVIQRPETNKNAVPSIYIRVVRPILAQFGFIIGELGGPIMTAGMFHGFAKKVSRDYSILVKKYPSGKMIFLIGLALRIIGNSFIRTYFGSLQREIHVERNDK